MNKLLNVSLIVFSIAGLVGCADTESIPSNRLFKTVSEKNMPYHCRQEVSKELGVYSGNIYLYPIEHSRGAKIIYGKYSEDSRHLKEFACIYNNNDTYAGIKMQHSNVKNTGKYRV